MYFCIKFTINNKKKRNKSFFTKTTNNHEKNFYFSTAGLGGGNHYCHSSVNTEKDLGLPRGVQYENNQCLEGCCVNSSYVVLLLELGVNCL